IRKIVVCAEETMHDGGPVLATPVRKAWAAAVVGNPYAGHYAHDIMPMMDALKPLGIELSRRLVAALGGAAAVDAYGKGVIVGSAGEIEHSALWHVPGGYAMREILGTALAIVPSACKMGAIGASLDLPIHHKDACYVR
ncbi:amino acid synthesis family protein, partial [Herbaspirillum sp. HC18]